MAAETSERAHLVNDLMERIGQTVGQRAQASAIFGEPVEREGVTVIPVAKARFGFGGGGATGSHEGEARSGSREVARDSVLRQRRRLQARRRGAERDARRRHAR